MSNRTKKRIVKSTRILAIILAIMTVLSIVIGFTNKVYAENSWEELGQLVGETAIWTAINYAFVGLPAIFMTIAKLFLMVLGLIEQGLMSAVYSSLEGKLHNVSLVDIIFSGAEVYDKDGKPITSQFLSVDFFNFDTQNTVGVFRTQIAKWYYILRLISTAILLVILIYIGIRMALSTIAQEQAKYKQMLVDWITSLALLFILHYIIMFTIKVNSALVTALYKVATSGKVDTSLFSAFFNGFNSVILLIGFEGIFAAALYFMFMGRTLIFFILYMKRMITVGFLIMIAPLITITYSIDKIGDGKSQALNAWLKELVYNILIQPFHCIIYLAFFSAIKGMITKDTVGIGAYVFAVVVMKFMQKAEEILKKIFHFEASSMSSMSDAGQTFANAKGQFVKWGAAGGAMLANFNKAGGWSVARKISKENWGKIKGSVSKVAEDAKASKEVKSQYLKEHTKDEFKKYKKTDEYKEAKKTTAAEMKKQSRANKMASDKKKYDKKFEKGAYDKEIEKYDKEIEQSVRKDLGSEKYDQLKAMAAKKDKNGNSTRAAKNAQAILDESKAKNSEKYHNKIMDEGSVGAKRKLKNGCRTASGVYNNMRTGLENLAKTPYGQLVVAGMKDSAKVATAIALGATAYGASGNMNDAISFGQLGFGAASGFLENTKSTIGGDTATLMAKLMSVDPNITDIKDELNSIFDNTQLGKFEKVTEKLDGYLSQFKAILGSEKMARELSSQIREAIRDDTQDFNLEAILSKYKLGDDDKGELKNQCVAFSALFSRSLISKKIQQAESMNIDISGSLTPVVEKKVERYEKYIERRRKSNLNVEVKQGTNGVDVTATDENGNSTRETAPTGNGPGGNGPTGNP